MKLVSITGLPSGESEVVVLCRTNDRSENKLIRSFVDATSGSPAKLEVVTVDGLHELTYTIPSVTMPSIHAWFANDDNNIYERRKVSTVTGTTTLPKGVKPISAKEFRTAPANFIPNEVIEAFNELISQVIWNPESFSIGQEEVTRLIVEKIKASGNHMSGISINISDKDHEAEIRKLITKNKWLDIESIYEAQGWKVTYKKPA